MKGIQELFPRGRRLAGMRHELANERACGIHSPVLQSFKGCQGLFWLRTLLRVFILSAGLRLVTQAADETAALGNGAKTAQQIMDVVRESVVVIKQLGRDG